MAVTPTICDNPTKKENMCNCLAGVVIIDKNFSGIFSRDEALRGSFRLSKMEFSSLKLCFDGCKSLKTHLQRTKARAASFLVLL